MVKNSAVKIMLCNTALSLNFDHEKLLSSSYALFLQNFDSQLLQTESKIV